MFKLPVVCVLVMIMVPSCMRSVLAALPPVIYLNQVGTGYLTFGEADGARVPLAQDVGDPTSYSYVPDSGDYSINLVVVEQSPGVVAAESYLQWHAQGQDLIMGTQGGDPMALDFVVVDLPSDWFNPSILPYSITMRGGSESYATTGVIPEVSGAGFFPLSVSALLLRRWRAR